MPEFKDSEGRKWEVKLDAPKIEKVRERLNIDLVAIDNNPVDTMHTNFVLLVNTLHVLCEEQCEKRNLGAKEFGEALVGDHIDAATTALTQAVENFVPSRVREVMRAQTAKMNSIRESAMSEWLATINNPELEAAAKAKIKEEAEKETRKILTQLLPATNTPESSASAPPVSP